MNHYKSSYKKLTSKVLDNYYFRELAIIILLILATIIINWRMINDGLNGKIDMIWHITWLQHFFAQISEGIWYPRWLAGTNYGYGSPTFVFYPPLVYYLGSFLKYIGLNTKQTIIFLFSSAIFISGFNFYVYGRSRWGIIASLVGSLAYMTAPYLAFMTYWVSSLSSVFAIAWIPLCFWLTEKTIFQQKWGIGLALFWAILALTHMPSLILFWLFWVFYTLFLLFNFPWKAILRTFMFAGIGLGLASFYLLPAIIEKSLVNIDAMKNIGGGFRASMLGASQNSLIPLNLDSSAPHVFVHQSLAIIIINFIILVCFRNKTQIAKETISWLSFSIVLAFFMSYLSWSIWQAVPILQRVQFSLRLLFIYSFINSVLYSIVAKGIISLKSMFKYPLLLIIILMLMINLSFGYKLSRKFPTFDNPGRANLEHLANVKTALENPYTNKLKDVAEYIPLLSNGQSAPAPMIGQPRVSVMQGKAKVKIQSWGSYNRVLEIETQEPSTIRIKTYFYPAWNLYVNQASYPINVLSDGTIGLKLNPGFYTVKLTYQYTVAFIIGTVFSLISIVILFSLSIIDLKWN